MATSKFHLIHVTKNDLYFLTVVSKECSPLFIIEAQQCIVNMLDLYFKNPSENIIRENFSMVYQILDEMVDGGFPFTTEQNQLTEMIVPPSVATRVLSVLGGGTTVKDQLSGAALSKTPWRRSEVKYLTDEIYFDILESVDMIINANDQVVSAAVAGEIRCRCSLSGIPDLAITFKHKNAGRNAPILEDVALHRCIRINRFLKEKVVSFVPPDGKFTLLTYRVRENIRTPVYVRPTFHWFKTSAKFTVQAGLKFEADSPVTDIVITIPFPKAILSSTVTANVGVVKVDQLTKTCRWEIPKMVPKEPVTPMLEGSLSLNPDVPIEERPIIRVAFEAVKFSASGLQIDGLSVRNVKYTPVRGVRVVSAGGRFQIRTA